MITSNLWQTLFLLCIYFFLCIYQTCSTFLFQPIEEILADWWNENTVCVCVCPMGYIDRFLNSTSCYTMLQMCPTWGLCLPSERLLIFYIVEKRKKDPTNQKNAMQIECIGLDITCHACGLLWLVPTGSNTTVKLSGALYEVNNTLMACDRQRR